MRLRKTIHVERVDNIGDLAVRVEKAQRRSSGLRIQVPTPPAEAEKESPTRTK